MAKYEIKMSCGHVETIQLFGKMTDRDKKIAWLEEHGICTACYKARQDAAHAEETAAAKAKADEENLPELNGSEKQVNWALSIRAKKFEALNEMFANANANATDEQRQQNQIALQAAKNVLASKTESRFWIDNRNTPARKLIAQNGLQDELKAEFARLTAEASATEEVDPEEYAVSTEAQDVAVAAEIELATATNTNDEHEQEAITMTITTTTNKAGKISGYYVDGVKTRKADIDFIINRRHGDIIVVDYHVGTEFRSLTRSPYQLKVVLTGMEYPIMTQAAADELGYKIVKAFSGSYNGTTFVVAKQADVDKSTINTTTATDITDNTINIDDATYRTILLHAEKISNGQNSFAAVLKNELRNLLNVDASELVEAIKTDSNYLNRVRCYLADFPIIITNDEGTRYRLVKLTDDYCELDIINDEPAITTEQEKSTIDEPEPPVDDFDTKLAELQAKRDAAQAALLKAQEEHEAAENTLQKFLSDTAGDLATKLQSLKLDYSIKLVTKNGYSWTVTDFDNIYVDAFDGGKMFAFTDWRSRKYARYGTPAQVDKVIDMLRAAIERGDKEFKFPTVDELTTTRKAA